MQNVYQHYQDRIAFTLNQLAQLKKQINLVAIFRLTCFMVLVLAIYQLFQGINMVKIVLSLLGLVSFLASISWFVHLQEKQEANKSLLEILQNELTCLEGGINCFENGANYEDGLGYWIDLDIFGNRSMYHYLNRTNTKYGSNALAEHLKAPLPPVSIIAMQSAVKSYSQQILLVESLIAVSQQKKSALISLESVEVWLSSPNQLVSKKWLQFIRYELPVINIFLLGHSIYSANPALLGFSFLVGWGVIGVHGKYLQSGFKAFDNKQLLLKQYISLLEKFKELEAGNSKLLTSDKEVATHAFLAIQELTKLSNRVDQRLNLFAMLIFNPYFLYDIQNMMALENWKTKYRDQFNNWLELIGRIELLNCFAVFSFQHPNYTVPIVSKDPLHLSATKLSHPLIPNNQSVGNDLELGKSDKLWLVTGSNMSGKTTFLRAIGLNLVLAQAGLPVAAISFSFSPMQIFSSIRISDSLAENTSYFMAELKKLQALKKGVQSSKASLVLIDEILRGTNSEDKYHGSAEFVKELISMDCLSLFATHDLKLGLMEQVYPGLLANYCFESIIENNTLYFDYTIRPGVAQNKNASFLMKQMGII